MFRSAKGGLINYAGSLWCAPELPRHFEGRVEVLLTEAGTPQARLGDGPLFDLVPWVRDDTEAAGGPESDPAGEHTGQGQAREPEPAQAGPRGDLGLVVGRVLAPGELGEDRDHALRRREVREVAVRLTPEELAEVAKEQASAFDAYLLARMQEQKRHKDAMRPIKQLLAQVEELSSVHSSGVQLRSLEVEDWADYKAGELVTVRTDTFEVLAVEALSEEERQQRLKLAPVEVNGASYTWPSPSAPAVPPDLEVTREALVKWLHGQGEAACQLWTLADPVHRLQVVRKLADGELLGHEDALAELGNLEAMRHAVRAIGAALPAGYVVTEVDYDACDDADGDPDDDDEIA